jgi:hypothetical protein
MDVDLNVTPIEHVAYAKGGVDKIRSGVMIRLAGMKDFNRKAGGGVEPGGIAALLEPEPPERVFVYPGGRHGCLLCVAPGL